MMKKIFLVPVLLLIGFAVLPAQENPSVTIVNNTGEPITAFSIRHSGTDWRRYTFTGNASLASGQSFNLRLPNPLDKVNRYDIKLERPNSLGTYTKSNAAVSAGGRIEFTPSDKDGGSNAPGPAPSQQYDPESDFKTSRLSDGKSVAITGYAGSKQTVRIPPTIQGLPVTAISDKAFEGKNLTSVTIPKGVTRIGTEAFRNCAGLTSVTIPNSVTHISEGAFEGCAGLANVTIPNSVKSIGDDAFSKCAGLTSITIPYSVTRIGYAAFNGCAGLASVTFRGRIASDKLGETNDSTIAMALKSGQIDYEPPFPGDLREKFLTEGIGTYTRASGSNTWTKR